MYSYIYVILLARVFAKTDYLAYWNGEEVTS